MADFNEGRLIQITVADDTVYVAVDGDVLLRARAPLISVSLTQDHRQPQQENAHDNRTGTTAARG